MESSTLAPLASFLRRCAGPGKPPVPPPAAQAIQRKYGAIGRLARAAALSLLLGFAGIPTLSHAAPLKLPEAKQSVVLSADVTAKVKDLLAREPGLFCAPIAATGSMRPTLDENWLVIMKPNDIAEVEKGDIVARKEGHRVVLHRVKDLVAGTAITQGDNRQTEDFIRSDKSNHVGVMVAAVHRETGQVLERWNQRIGRDQAPAKLAAIAEANQGSVMTVPARDGMDTVTGWNVVVAPMRVQQIRRNDLVLVKDGGAGTFRRVRGIRDGGFVVKTDESIYNEMGVVNPAEIQGVVVAFAGPIDGTITVRAENEPAKMGMAASATLPDLMANPKPVQVAKAPDATVDPLSPPRRSAMLADARPVEVERGL